MVNVRIPCEDFTKIQKIVTQMQQEDNTYMVAYQYDGNNYARFSAQIYTSVSDFIYVAQKFLDHLTHFQAKQTK